MGLHFFSRNEDWKSDPRIALSTSDSQSGDQIWVRSCSVLNGLEWIVLTVAILEVYVVGDLVLCGGQAYCKQFMGRQ